MKVQNEYLKLNDITCENVLKQKPSTRMRCLTWPQEGDKVPA